MWAFTSLMNRILFLELDIKAHTHVAIFWQAEVSDTRPGYCRLLKICKASGLRGGARCDFLDRDNAQKCRQIRNLRRSLTPQSSGSK